MFKGRRFAIANPVKPRYSSESRVSKRPSSSSSGRRSCQWSEGDSYDGPHDDDGVYSTIDDLDYLAEIREDDGTVEDLMFVTSLCTIPQNEMVKSNVVPASVTSQRPVHVAQNLHTHCESFISSHNQIPIYSL